jgi:hypothetical protein
MLKRFFITSSNSRSRAFFWWLRLHCKRVGETLEPAIVVELSRRWDFIMAPSTTTTIKTGLALHTNVTSLFDDQFIL